MPHLRCGFTDPCLSQCCCIEAGAFPAECWSSGTDPVGILLPSSPSSAEDPAAPASQAALGCPELWAECTLLVPVQRLGKGCGSPCPITARTQLDGEWVCSGCRSWITSGGFEVLFFNTKCLSHCVAQNPWRQRCARLCMDRGKILGILRAV